MECFLNRSSAGAAHVHDPSDGRWPVSPAECDERISFTLLFTALVRRRRLALGVLLSGCLLSLGLALLLPVRYTARATILPSGDRLAGGALGSALSMMNLDLGGEVPPNSSFLFPTILSSRRLRDGLLETEFDSGGGRAALIELLGERETGRARDRLGGMIDIERSDKTGIVTVEATTADPVLSAAVAARAIELLAGYVEDGKRTGAWREYEFILAELERAGDSLRAAEERLTAFEGSHMDHRRSTDPLVTMEHERLSLGVELAADAYVDLVRRREIADIELRRETPLVRVLDEPVPPAMKSAPPRKLIVLVGGVFSLLGCVLLPLSMEIHPARILARIFGD